MPRVLLAWEGGAGRGHVVTLKTVAEALGAPAHVDAALSRMEHARELAGVCGAVFQGVALSYDSAARAARGQPKTATWGEFLCDLGFRDPEFLIRQIGWWRDVIVSRRIGLVVGDYAPCALLAARSLGVAGVGVGTGYGQPPSDMDSFPVLIADHSERIYDEREMVLAVNAALAHFGAPGVERAPEIYRVDDQLVRALPMLDPYRNWRKSAYLPPVADVASKIYAGGDEIFAYFSTTELNDPALVEAVATLGVPTRMFAPGASAETLARLAGAPHITIETAPVPIDLIAQRSRMMANAAQNGTLSMGLACGLPQASAPQHLEQEFNARGLEAHGALRRLPRGGDVRALRETLLEVYHSAPMRAAARELAREARPQMMQDARSLIRARLDHVMTAKG